MYRKILRAYKSILDKLDRAEMIFCIVLLAIVVTLNAVEIFTRYFLKYSSVQSNEIGLLLIQWMYFVGFVVLFYHSEDVIMEYFYNLLPAKVRPFLDWATSLAILVFVGMVFKECVNLRALTKLKYHEVLPVRYSFMGLPLLVGSLLALMVSVYFVWIKTDKLVREYSSKGVPDIQESET